MRNNGLFLMVLLVLCCVLVVPGMASCPEPPHWADGQEVVRLNTIGWLDDELSLTLKNGTAASASKDSCFVWVSEPGDAIFPERRRILGFYQDNTWYEVQETHLNMRPAEVPRPELPSIMRVTEETNTAELAKKAGVPEWKFQQWNHTNYTKPLLGEVFYMEEPLPGQYCERWSRFNGDPVGDKIPLNEQIYIFNRCRTPDDQIPDEVLQHWRSQSEASDGTLITLYSTNEHRLFLDGLIMGGQNPGSEVKPWGRTYCDWVEAGTTTPVTQAEAYAYKPFVFGGYSWQLIKFKKCQNGAFIRIKLGEGELVSLPFPTPPPAPVVTETPVDESVPPSVPMPARPARDWRRRGVLWVDGYRYEFNPDGQHQWSAFAGTEMAFRIGKNSFLGLPKFAVVPRVEQFIQAIDLNRFARGGDYGGNYSLGAEFHLIQRSGFIVRPQAGVGYTYQQRSWRTERIEGGNRIKERRRYNFDDTWWYVRPNMSGPYRSYAEYYIRRDFVHDEGFNLTIEPSILYARYGWGRTTRGGQSTYDMIAGQRTKVSWPGDYYRISQAKLGVNITQRWLSYGIWEDQVYSSTEWYANSPNGYGLGTQYYFLPNRFRVVVEAKHWPNYDTVDRGWERVLASQNVPAVDIRWGKARTHGNRQEYHVGLVYNW